jgi:hypothetical protein
MVVVYDNIIFDSSYEVVCKKMQYIHALRNINMSLNSKEDKRQLIALFVKFLQYEKRLEDTLAFCDKDYYLAQEAYVRTFENKV